MRKNHNPSSLFLWSKVLFLLVVKHAVIFSLKHFCNCIKSNMSPAAEQSCWWRQSAEQKAPSQGGEPARRSEWGRPTCGARRRRRPTAAAERRSCPDLPPTTNLLLTKLSNRRKQNGGAPVLMRSLGVCGVYYLPGRCPAEFLTGSQCESSSAACRSHRYHSAPERKTGKRWRGIKEINH